MKCRNVFLVREITFATTLSQAQWPSLDHSVNLNVLLFIETFEVSTVVIELIATELLATDLVVNEL